MGESWGGIWEEEKDEALGLDLLLPHLPNPVISRECLETLTGFAGRGFADPGLPGP